MSSPTRELTDQPDAPAGPATDTSAPAAPTPEQRPLARRLANAAMVMVILTTLASATNYVSTLVFSRFLPPDRFGDLTALLALSVVLAVPTGAAQTLIAERVAVLSAEGRMPALQYLIRHASAHIALLAGVGTIIYAASIPVVTSVLDLEGPGPAIALAPLLLTSFLVPFAFGVLQGLDRFIALGAMMLLSAVSRIAFGVPLVALTGGAGGALAAQAIGNVLVVALTVWMLRAYLLRRGTGAASSGLRRRIDASTAFAGAAFIAFALLSNLDIVLAKIFLSRYDVGLYAALSTLAKVVLFLPGAVAVVMVPNAARARHTSGSSSRVLRIAAGLVAVTTALAAVPAALAPDLVLRIMFGSDYAGARAGVLPIVCAGAGLAMLYLLVVYSVAIRDRRWVGVLLLGVVLQVGGIALFHGSPAEIATVQAVVVLLVLVVNEAAFHPLVRSRRLVGRAT